MFDRFLHKTPITSVTPQEAWERLSSQNKQANKTFLIDVREAWEYSQGHAKGARNIPLGQLRQHLSEIPKDQDVYLICQSGGRSSSAARMLMQEGYTRVININGGTGMWRVHQLPMA
jgi:rhodanese-related sulfurtransferase